MIQFSQTFMLWALAGLSIPIAIHFLSRKEGKVIRLGSIRHLEETTTQKFKGIRLNELLLLAIRCLLLVVFALLLSGVRLSSETRGTAKWLLLEKGLEADARLQTLRDSLEAQGFEIRFLSKGFPTLKNSGEDSSSYYQLVNDLRQEDLQKVLIVSYNKSKRFKGERFALPSHVQWISLPAIVNKFEVNSWISGQDSLYTRLGYSQENITYFETTQRKLNSEELASMSRPAPPRIAIVSDAAYVDDQRIIEAALKSISDYQQVEFQIATHTIAEWQAMPADADFLFWLSDASLPTSLSKVLYVKADQYSPLIVQENPLRWRITKHLNPTLALQENLTVQLASLLLASESVEKEVQRNDVRTLPDSIVWKEHTQPESKSNSAIWIDADSYLLYILLLLIIIERIMAYQRKQ